MSRRRYLPVVLLLAVHSGLLAYSAWVHSPTLNEPGHLVAGLSHWKYGNFTLYRVNPPLVRLVAAFPAHLLGYVEDRSGYYDGVGSRAIAGMGRDFVQANGRRSFFLISMGRMACIPFSIFGGWICFKWARELYSISAGYMACLLWCFSPMVLGHGAMIAPDAHATSLGLAACYTFWRWLKKPTWSQAIITGGVLGLAELSKTTMILFYPLWPVLWFVYRIPARHEMTLRQWRTEAAMLVVRMVIGIYILNLGYLGEGTGKSLGEFKFVSKLFAGEELGLDGGGNRFENCILGRMPMPFPMNYIVGIDIQQKDFENFSRPSYMRGKYQAKGWWYYYVYAVLVKAPLGSLLLVAPLAFLRLPKSPKRSWGDILILLSPALLIFSVASLKFGFSHHSRYVLPCAPFIFVWLSQLARPARSVVNGSLRFLNGRKKGTGSLRCRRLRLLGVTTVLLVGWSIGSSLAVYPHSISHFNELVGGPRHGPKHLINSNVDWGQDLLMLEKWIEKNAREKPVFLAFYNSYSPFDEGILNLEDWPFFEGNEEIRDGYFAISVNLLYDFPWSLHSTDGEIGIMYQRINSYLRGVEPVGRAGFSIRIFSTKQIRNAFSAREVPPLWEVTSAND